MGQFVVILSSDGLFVFIEQFDLVMEIPNLSGFEEMFGFGQKSGVAGLLRRRRRGGQRSNELLLFENIVGEKKNTAQRLRWNRHGCGRVRSERTEISGRLDLSFENEKGLFTDRTGAKKTGDGRGDLFALVAAYFQNQFTRCRRESHHLERIECVHRSAPQ